MRSPRSVTMQPMEFPSLSLNWAIDFRAFVTTGFWPAICVSSFTATSISFPFWVASPSPILIDTFSRRGTAITFLYPNSLVRAGIAFVL